MTSTFGPATGEYWNRADVTAQFAALAPPPYLLSLLARRPATRAGAIGLDAGCGGGRNLLPLMEAGYRPVGVDLHPAMIGAARRACRSAELHTASVTALPLGDQSSDIVLCHGVLHNLPSRAEYAHALNELARVMRADALLSLNVFSSEYIDACLRPTCERDLYLLPNGQVMTLLSPADIAAMCRDAGLVPHGAVATYLRKADPGQRSVWRALLRRQRPGGAEDVR